MPEAAVIALLVAAILLFVLQCAVFLLVFRAYDRFIAFLASPQAIGPKGETGERGFTGEPGPQGARGDRGERGEKGERGERGEPGKSGITGPLPVGRTTFMK